MQFPRWRIVLLAFLFLAPVGFLIGYGSYQLWMNNLWVWVWWPMFISLALGYFLAWRWQAHRKLLSVDFTPDMHWTDRDKEAWKLVAARAESITNLSAEQLTDINTYADTAREMADELAKFYHPRATDPVGNLTVPELLAVVELAAHDLSEMVRQYLPAGHLLTVNDWKRAKQAVDWYQTGSNIYWAISAIFSPYNTALRYLASRFGLGTPIQLLQQNLLVWFYTAYIHRLGTYLIELNSGRLRVGATRYRELIEQYKAQEGGTPDGMGPVPSPGMEDKTAVQVGLTIMGQVKAGKSSLINAILGNQQAVVSVLPETNAVTEYRLSAEHFPQGLRLLDSPGYGHEGPKEDQLRQTEKAARLSDLLLLVVHARNPARQADLLMLQGLRKWFDSQPNLKMPKVLAVMSHIDLLSPALEWDPPYNWQEPKRPKEQQIHEAAEAVREQLGEYLVGVIPVCLAQGKIYGVEEFLLPAITGLLPESRATAFLRCLHQEAELGKYRKVFEQALAGGKELIKALWKM